MLAGTFACRLLCSNCLCSPPSWVHCNNVSTPDMLNHASCAAGAMQRFNDTEGYNPRESNVLRMLGYFSLIGLQRVHTLVGDYHGALKAIHPLNLFEVGSPCSAAVLVPSRSSSSCTRHMQTQRLVRQLWASKARPVCTAHRAHAHNVEGQLQLSWRTRDLTPYRSLWKSVVAQSTRA